MTRIGLRAVGANRALRDAMDRGSVTGDAEATLVANLAGPWLRGDPLQALAPAGFTDNSWARLRTNRAGPAALTGSA